MENKESGLTNPISVEKARTEDLSGLYPVFEELGNGIDIQPLEDVRQEEIIPFEDNTDFEEQQEEIPDEKENKKSGRRRGLIRAAVIVAVMCAIAFAGYNVFVHFNDFAHPAEAVYQKDDKVHILLDNSKEFEIENVVEAKLSEDGSYLVYSQNSTTKTGKLDIRMIELKKRSSVRNKGTLAVSGADEGWKASSDCAYVYYTVTQDDACHYYAYITADKESQPVVFDASEVFLPPNGDIVYFTRESGQENKLFRMRIGEKASAVSKVDGVKAFSDGKTQEIFYTVLNEDDSYKLYRITKDSEPLEIAPDVSEVYLEDYKVGGNLYYFVKSGSKLNWSDFISDEYADSDSAMKMPDKKDYTRTVGFIFKREKLDESAYNLALEKYEQKTLRDSVREALDNADIGLAVSSEYRVKVFDGEKSRELAGGVKLENLVAFSKDGNPRIVVKKSGIGPNTVISMDSLYQTARQNSVEQAVDYAIQTLKSGGYEISSGYKYSFCNGTNVYEYDFAPSYDVSSASILFGGKNSIFAAVKSDKKYYDIYWCRVDGDSVSKEKRIAEGVTTFESVNGKIYLTAASDNVNNDLYVFSPDGSGVCICENSVKHFISDDGTAAALKTEEDESIAVNAELIFYDGKRVSEVDGGVYLKNVVVKNDRIAYIKNYAQAADKGEPSGGTMIIYENGKRTEINSSVSRIFDIK